MNAQLTKEGTVMPEKLQYIPKCLYNDGCLSPDAPEAFAFYDEKFGWHIRNPENGDPSDEQNIALHDGKPVLFYATGDYVHFTLTVGANGTYETSEPLPDGLNGFGDVTGDIPAYGTIKEFIENNDIDEGAVISMFGSWTSPEPVTLQCNIVGHKVTFTPIPN